MMAYARDVHEVVRAHNLFPFLVVGYLCLPLFRCCIYSCLEFLLTLMKVSQDEL